MPVGGLHQVLHYGMLLAREFVSDFVMLTVSTAVVQRKNLGTHIRVEHEGRRFPCPLPTCDRAFRFLASLRQHLASHTEDEAAASFDTKVWHAGLAGSLCGCVLT